MEIINYSEKTVRTPSFVLKGATKRLRTAKASTGFSYTATRPRAKTRVFSVKDFIEDARGSLIYLGRVAKPILRFLLAWIWTLPALALCVTLPSLAGFYGTKALGYARPVAIEENNSFQDNILDLALFNFAMAEQNDAEGNILSLEGLAESKSISFKDKVVWQNYKVKSGDTISGISQKFGLRNISTLIAVNSISNVREIRQGQVLKIPSIDGLVHKVAAGENLDSIATKYKVSIDDLLDVNDLTDVTLAEGQELFIPGARLDNDTIRRSMGELFSYPIKASWRLTSRFGRRIDPISNVPSNHTGIDMACPTGTPIYAALSGTVVVAGWSNIYGNYVIIKHIDGYQTLYGHMNKILTKKGEYVSQGAKIGLVGSTGYSTGPHLHFSVYKNGKLTDPLSVLK